MNEIIRVPEHKKIDCVKIRNGCKGQSTLNLTAWGHGGLHIMP